MKLTAADIKRFKSKLKLDKKTNCLEWTAAITTHGYGQFKLKRKGIAAHRVAWTIANGAIPKGTGFHGTCVLHHCDNRKCCQAGEPGIISHLFLGTVAENNLDRDAKGRGADARGMLNNLSKLTDDDVKEIRKQWKLHVMHARDDYTQTKIAKRFGVCQQVVSKVVRDESWSHVP